MEFIFRAYHHGNHKLYDVVQINFSDHHMVLKLPEEPTPFVEIGGKYPFEYYHDLRNFTLLWNTGRMDAQHRPIYRKISGPLIDPGALPELNFEQE
jgi:hypothetical protein